MDKVHKKIATKLRMMTETPNPIRMGKVVAVDADKGTMDVVLSMDADDGTATPDMLLTGVSGDMNGIVMIPAVGSYVVVAQIQGNGNYSLIRATDIDKYLLTIGNSILTVTADGYKIERGAESVTKLLKDLLNAIVAATYTNGAGTTSPANNLSTFQNILTRIDNILI